LLEREKIACESSGFPVIDHFATVGKMVVLGSGAKRKQLEP
jgi:hypothetical protein